MPDRPRLADLVPAPFALRRRQRAVALGRPIVAIIVSASFAARGWALAAAACVPVVFATTVVVLHDLFHGNLGIRRRTNAVALTLYGALLLNSGHALARSHRHHHRTYPGPGDPEAYVDGWPIWRVVVEGPIYRFRVWAWAWRRDPGPRLAGEMAVWVAAWLVAARFPVARPYVVVAELGSWTFPLISVTGVHDRHAPGPLQQTRTVRSAAAGRLLLGMQHHLEHHLYPRVPAARLGEVARALDPWLLEEGAAIWSLRGGLRFGAEPQPSRARAARTSSALPVAAVPSGSVSVSSSPTRVSCPSAPARWSMAQAVTS